MKLPLLKPSVFFLVVAISAHSLTATEPPADGPVKFTAKFLGLDANEGIDLADFNGDGLLDVVAGRNWFAAPNFLPSPVRSIEDWNGYVESNGDFAVDVDKDGLIDVVAGSFQPTEVYWFKNPGKEALALGQMWPKKLLVDTGYGKNEGSFMRDIDGDGRLEWISNSWDRANPTVVWSFSEEERTETTQQGQKTVEKKVKAPTLTKHIIGPNINGHGMGFGDVNNDGREDILVGLGWYERPDGDPFATTWKFHGDWDYLHASCPMIVRDFDKDGINDILWGKGHDYGLLLWKGKGTDKDGKQTFEEFMVDKEYSQPHTLHMADIDGDGQEELISGKRVRAHNGRDPGGLEQAVIYYYKWDGKQNKFNRHTIDDSGRVGTGLQIRTADLNGDGRLDIAVAGKSGTYILFNNGK